ncbi:MAG: hypothetical protein A2600_12885 [Candidatus Lambdaproteobacteria bacterium RIFOXYD1_FULL_56_27]|uniref:Uncharacterized protein n=1 Tax=Candidatus Lambdaproteobacteria bacterium RIFOXYD2_FULL_56_26 TaxID=1817773 RepID=A0A1F6GP62_9PROT|nr:MAG: hypothetical protein A2557_12120 [Candidatus Lambdaproteobacteria bacterium RIFOXYD2_FULL_56_26]OGH09876.1 MAG: hypothetical protein A2600_12885 [Candidatus Lambdaproteobacteria bacterium RIFOXYD1_FULL_56_27]
MMPLTPQELRQVRRAIAADLELLNTASAKEGRGIRRRIAENLTKLGETVKSEQTAAAPQDKRETPTFDDLVAGKFDELNLKKYIPKVRAAFKEIQEVAPLIQPVERYATINGKSMNESFWSDLLGDGDQGLALALSEIGATE